MKLEQSIIVGHATAKKLIQQGKQPLKSKEWREMVGRKTHRHRLWKVFGSEQFLPGMWEYFTLKRAWARKIFADTLKKNKYENKVSGEVLEHVKRKCDTDCNAQIMRRDYTAGKSGNWESFREEFRKRRQTM